MGVRRFTKIAVFLLLFVSDANHLRAQQRATKHEQPLQEVFQTDLVYPQEKNEIQLGLAPRWHWKSGSYAAHYPLAIEFGLTDSWELDFDWDAQVRRGEASQTAFRGIGDWSIGTKYSFMNMAGSPFHAALGLEVSLPAGDINKKLTDGFIEYAPRLLLARDFPRWNYLQCFAEIGVSLVQRWKRHRDPADDESAAHEFFWNGGIFVPVRRWRFTVEANWRTNRWNHGGEDQELYLAPGVVWKLPGTWEVGVGVPLGIRGGSDRARLIIHVIFEASLPSRDR